MQQTLRPSQRQQQQMLLLMQRKLLQQQLVQPSVQVQALRLLLSCRKQRERLKQRLRPKRVTCSFLESLDDYEENNFLELSNKTDAKVKQGLGLKIDGEKSVSTSTPEHNYMLPNATMNTLGRT